jgi:EAL domain-containing protein (putative c-di-GMP-specific phosphodiesterase class I)
VAEGVDSVDVWRFLSEIGCDEVQGALFGDAVPVDELTAWLAARPRFLLRDGAAKV